MMAALAMQGPPVDAVYCGSDITAAGVLTECRERGIGVPRQLAVIGTGDAEFAQALYPPLTSIRVDGTRIGEEAAAMFLDRFTDRKRSKRVVDVGFTIVERESTGRSTAPAVRVAAGKR
jgi:LacI family gluconate utilization system Gnt-I transcriptional repressor